MATQKLSYCLREVLVEDQRADDNEYEPAKNFSALTKHVPDAATDHDADRYHREGRQANGAGDDPDVGIDKSEADTDCHGIDTGGETGNRQQPKRMRLWFGLCE